MTKRNLTIGRSMKTRPLLRKERALQCQIDLLQKALRESEAKYRIVVDQSLDGIVIAQDSPPRLVFANSAIAKILGYTTSELTSLSPKETEGLVHPEDRANFFDRFRKHLQGKPAEPRYEFRGIRKDGEGRWLEVSSNRIDYKGQPALQATFVDITERKKAEEKLRQSEERYRSLFDRMLDGVYRSTHEGRFVDVNSALVKMFRYSSRQEMLDIADIKKELYFSPEERGSHVLDTGKEEVEAYRMRRKDGSEIWVEDHGHYVHDEQGNVIYHEGILRDITERRRMEAELETHTKHLEELVEARTRRVREGEEQLRAVLNATTAAVMVLDREGRISEANDAFCKLWGLNHDEVVGRNAFSLLKDPEVRERRKIWVDEVFRTGQYVRKEDEDEGRWMDSIMYPVRGPDGNVVAVAMYALNITDRKRMEEELRSTKERLEYVIQSNPAVIYSGKPLADLSDWEFTFVSDGVASMLGYEPEKFVGPVEFWNSHVHPDDLQASPMVVQTLWREGHRTFEYRFQHKDGSYRWIHDEASVTRYSEGKPIEIHGYWTDITARKQAEQALQESEDRYRRLFEGSPISLWEEDFSAVKQFLDELRQKGVSDFDAYFANHPEDIAKCAALVKVLNMNKATLNLYNAKSVDEIIGGLSGVLTERSNRAFVGELVALVQGKKYFEAEFENRTLRGETKHCSVICSVVPGYEQSLAKVLISIVDLTPQKKLEAELVKSQRLAAIGETAAMVGHDLRNPLQGIAGAAYNIRRNLRNAVDPSTKEMLGVIDNGVQYANGIINDLLEFSREMQLQPVPTTPRSIVRRTLTDVKVPSNITIEDTTADAPEILADEPKLKRVLTNLIENAIDAMPDGGKMSISSMNTQQEVSICVRDTGLGIPQDMVEKIWTVLYTTKSKGIGLGLPICRRIIEAHGGSISVESTVGNGTTFMLKLPIQHVQAGGELS